MDAVAEIKAAAVAAGIGADADTIAFSLGFAMGQKGAAAEGPKKAVFFDMVHSNNAARVRLWIRLKELDDTIETKMVTYPDLQTKEFALANPLKKVPALVDSFGTSLFESFVIMGYLEDKYGDRGMPLALGTAEERAFVNLLVRIHDLYIASPNCTQPGFAHTQGCMYLAPYETKFCAAARCMGRETRAKKLAEIWKQLSWLEANVKAPYMAGEQLTHADLTWYPTCIFMEYMLPRVFKWPAVFHEQVVFPKLAAWFELLTANPVFAKVHAEIWDFWVAKDAAGQFVEILEELKDDSFKWVYP